MYIYIYIYVCVCVCETLVDVRKMSVIQCNTLHIERATKIARGAEPMGLRIQHVKYVRSPSRRDVNPMVRRRGTQESGA